MTGGFVDPTRDTSHRPWAMPQRPWAMAQRWSDLLFMHWPVAVASLRALVPSRLTLDMYEDRPWVSLASFKLSDLRPRRFPTLPWVSEFPELNVRTYVVVDGKPGVYFFSLDAASVLAVIGARTVFHLPYYAAVMSTRRRADGMITYESRRIAQRLGLARFKAVYAPTGPAATSSPGSLDHWLTERYCLYAVGSGQRVYRTDIHHHPWPLQPAQVELFENTMASASHIDLPSLAPRVSFARTLDVVVWSEERVR